MEVQRQNVVFGFFNKIVLPQFQILFIFISAIAAILIAYGPYKYIVSEEPEIPLTIVTPEQFVAWGATPTRVSVGLYIVNFPELDFVHSSFVLEGMIWFEFDPALISIATISKFSFEKGEILQQSEPFTQVAGKKLFVRYNIRVRFKSELDFRRFPFDSHRLDLVLINRSVQPGEMIFRSYHSFFKLTTGIVTSGWQLFGTAVRTGWIHSTLDEYGADKVVSNPRAIFSVTLKRGGIRNIILILLPLFMLFFISLFCFAFDPETHSFQIFGLASGGVTGLLGYRFVIENMTPKVSYFVFSDQVFTIFLAASLFEFLYAVTIVKMGKLTPFIVVLRGILYISIHIFFLATWYYLLYKI